MNRFSKSPFARKEKWLKKIWEVSNESLLGFDCDKAQPQEQPFIMIDYKELKIDKNFYIQWQWFIAGYLSAVGE